MNNKAERKIRFGSYTKRTYRNVRRKLRKAVSREIGYTLKGAR